MKYKLVPIYHFKEIIGTYVMINGIQFIAVTDGVKITYPDGTKRFISNTRYD